MLPILRCYADDMPLRLMIRATRCRDMLAAMPCLLMLCLFWWCCWWCRYGATRERARARSRAKRARDMRARAMMPRRARLRLTLIIYAVISLPRFFFHTPLLYYDIIYYFADILILLPICWYYHFLIIFIFLPLIISSLSLILLISLRFRLEFSAQLNSIADYVITHITTLADNIISGHNINTHTASILHITTGFLFAISFLHYYRFAAASSSSSRFSRFLSLPLLRFLSSLFLRRHYSPSPLRRFSSLYH